MEMIGPYLEDSDQEVGPPPTLLQCITINVKTQTEVSTDDDHPGGEWMKFNLGNPAHYPFVYVDKDTCPHAAKNICYLSFKDGVIHQGTSGKKTNQSMPPPFMLMHSPLPTIIAQVLKILTFMFSTPAVLAKL